MLTAHATIVQLDKMLKNLDAWIEKALAFAATKKFEADTLVHARLAPDQFDFRKQVQAACDAAKFAAAYLSGTDAPAHPDTETTIAELRARIATCRSYLDSFSAASFDGAADRKVSPKWLQGKWIAAPEYLQQAALPNFYFHVTTAYSILRHNGVDLGKQDFMGGLPIQG
jgi:hypothetical protein